MDYVCATGTMFALVHTRAHFLALFLLFEYLQQLDRMSGKASPGKAPAPTTAPPAPPAAKSTNVVLLAAYLFFW